VFALELKFFLTWFQRGAAISQLLTQFAPLLCIAMLLILVDRRGDTPEGKRWFRIALTILGAYAAFAIVVAVRVPGGWNSLPEAVGGLVAVVFAFVGIVVLCVSVWRTKPPEDPNRALIQTWRARFR
jgi:peptidoglycan biosynthesis protein MviN/MurJ (putative lipid II flippase)